LLANEYHAIISSAKDFYAANKISEATYYYWQKKCRQPAPPPGQSFVPVKIAPSSSFVVASIQMPGLRQCY
jgi:hypothetical protein